MVLGLSDKVLHQVVDIIALLIKATYLQILPLTFVNIIGRDAHQARMFVEIKKIKDVSEKVKRL